MKQVRLCPLVTAMVTFLVWGCDGGTPLQPGSVELPGPMSMRGGGAESPVARMVPLKGSGAWEWDGSVAAPSAECAAAGGAFEIQFTGSLKLTHLGFTRNSARQCLGLTPSGPAAVFTRETFTAANGDQLVIYEDGTPLDPVPPGSDWGYAFTVEAGTGRFEGATGAGIAHGTIEPTSTGMRGKEFIRGVISSVGSSK